MGFGLNFFQILLVILLTVFISVDAYGPQTGVISTVTLGWLVGLFCGDGKTGLWIGSTLALMSLGVVGLGGASVPDYRLTTIVTTMITCGTGQDYSIGLAIGLPVGMLYMYIDVAIKTIGSNIAIHAQELIRKGEFEKGINYPLRMMLMNYFARLIPLFIVLIAGQTVVEAIVKFIPNWLYKGMQVAGSILPVTGMAILLNYLPVKKHWPYLLLGFVMYSYLGLSTLPVGLVGLALAAIYYMRAINTTTAAVAEDMEDE